MIVILLVKSGNEDYYRETSVHGLLVIDKSICVWASGAVRDVLSRQVNRNFFCQSRERSI